MRTEHPWARHWHWLIPLGLFAYFGLWVANGRGWLISVSDERDSRLVGRWSGGWKWAGFSGSRTLVFLADGTLNEGHGAQSGPRRSVWGAKDGLLHVKWLATDAWIGKAIPYTVSDDGRTLRLRRPERFGYLFPAVLRR